MNNLSELEARIAVLEQRDRTRTKWQRECQPLHDRATELRLEWTASADRVGALQTETSLILRRVGGIPETDAERIAEAADDYEAVVRNLERETAEWNRIRKEIDEVDVQINRNHQQFAEEMCGEESPW